MDKFFKVRSVIDAMRAQFTPSHHHNYILNTFLNYARERMHNKTVILLKQLAPLQLYST